MWSAVCEPPHEIALKADSSEDSHRSAGSGGGESPVILVHCYLGQVGPVDTVSRALKSERRQKASGSKVARPLRAPTTPKPSAHKYLGSGEEIATGSTAALKVRRRSVRCPK